VLRFGLMDLNMRDFIYRVRSMIKVNMFGQMEVVMKDNGYLIKYLVEVNIFGSMDEMYIYIIFIKR